MRLKKSSGSCANCGDRDVGVIYITHRMEELREHRRSRYDPPRWQTVQEAAMAEITTTQLISSWWGARFRRFTQREPLPPGKPMLEVHEVLTRVAS